MKLLCSAVVIKPIQRHELNGYKLTVDPTSKHVLEGEVILADPEGPIKIGDIIGYIPPKDEPYILPDDNHIVSEYLLLYIKES